MNQPQASPYTGGHPHQDTCTELQLRPATLYLVATPIGNLLDITLRALHVLRHCHIIAAEDTRHTRILLQFHGISKPLLSCHKFNERKRVDEILQRLQSGQTVALVTDAGTPGISDPGQRIVRAALDAGFAVVPVPGPCALIAAISASGLPTNEFHFLGFLPHKPGRRLRMLKQLSTLPGTLILYESPYRVLCLIEELAALCPDRQIVVAREITKKFEEFIRGTPNTILEHFRANPPRGEFVVMIAPETALDSPAEE